MEQTEEGLRLRQILAEYFAGQQNIPFARLFGSVAQGKETARSDVDVAVHSESLLTAEQLVSLQQELETLSHREVDVCDLRTAEGLFLYKIMTKGCTLKHQSKIHHRRSPAQHAAALRRPYVGEADSRRKVRKTIDQDRK